MIEVIRICDICGARKEQIIDKTLIEFNMKVSYDTNFICSDCVLEIHRLVELESEENDGRGIACVRNIISCLQKLDYVEKAKSIYQFDGDKIRSYPKIQRWFEKMFGCRTHLQKDCKDPLCKAIREAHEVKVLMIGKFTS